MKVGDVVPENITSSGVVEGTMGVVLAPELLLGGTRIFGVTDGDEDPDWLLTDDEIGNPVPRIGVCSMSDG